MRFGEDDLIWSGRRSKRAPSEKRQPGNRLFGIQAFRSVQVGRPAASGSALRSFWRLRSMRLATADPAVSTRSVEQVVCLSVRFHVLHRRSSRHVEPQPHERTQRQFGKFSYRADPPRWVMRHTTRTPSSASSVDFDFAAFLCDPERQETSADRPDKHPERFEVARTPGFRP